MRKIGSYGLLVSGVLLGTSAFATVTLPSLYVSIGGGYAEQLSMPGAGDFASISGTTGATSSSSQELGGRTAIGLNWQTSQRTSAGLELGAAIYGSQKYSQNNTSLDLNYYGIELLGVGTYSLGKLALIGKAGLTNERVHPEKDNLSNDNIESNDTVLPELGAGFGIKMNEHVQLSAMYYHTFGQDVSFATATESTELPSINAFDLELGFYF